MKMTQGFLHLYFYQLEKMLNEDRNIFNDVKFQSEEANTDEDLKKVLQKYIKEHNYITEYYTYDIQLDQHTSDKKVMTDQYVFKDLTKYYISNVFLPNELSSKHMEEIKKTKEGVFRNPDLFIEVTNESQIRYISVELKSTKGDKIPGSSVQQVDPSEWVIFVQHKTNSDDNKTSYKVAIGKYINTITDKLPFPDRSPRPEISFKTLVKWNEDCRQVSKDIVNFAYHENKIKRHLLTDWQDFLTNDWLNIVKQNRVKGSKKWFDRAIKLYSIKFASFYDSLDKDDKLKFIQGLHPDNQEEKEIQSKTYNSTVNI